MAYESFYFANGSIISDVRGLRDILMSAEGKHFEHHVNDYKNDFATWIEKSLLKPELALKLRETTDVYETIRILDESLGESKTNQEELFEETSDEEVEQKETTKEQDWDEDDSNKGSEKDEIEKEVEDIMSETKKVSEKLESSHESKVKVEKEQLTKINIKNHRVHEFRALLLGTLFGVLVGMIVMYILIMNGVF